MSRQLEAEALVLHRSPAGEHHLRLTLLSPTLGLLTAMVRESRASGKKSSRSKAAVSAQPDVFDHAVVQLSAPAPGAAAGAVYFIGEYQVQRRHSGLGRSYPALAAAAALAALIVRHAVHFESCAPVFALCCQALAALDAGAPPEAVHLKALFLLASAEGYAAREQWLPMLSPEDRDLALAVLNQPVAVAAGLPPAHAARLPRLRQACERWLAEHTDLDPTAPLKSVRGVS
jgi:recombinational DNA repair protein (RecF pathway)